MKKFLSVFLSVVMVLSVAAFASAEEKTGSYTLYNQTGENVTEIYLYEVGAADKGENYAPFHGVSKNLQYTAEEGTVLVLEFVTESGYTGHFDTLHIEEAPITLLSADAMTGATMISFTVPTGTGKYTMYNGTNEALKSLYIYPVGTEDKGTNYAENFEDGMVIEIESQLNTILAVEFETESGYVGTFNTLNIEEAPITLLSADAMTGATMISFFAPAAQ